jgi:hypothetical protein
MKRRVTGTTSERPYFPNSSRSRDDVGRRPPLVPLGLAETSRMPHTPGEYSYGLQQPQRVFFSKSDYSDGSCYEEEDSDNFELMNVTIVIYGVSGIMCEKQTEKRRKPKIGTRDRSMEDSFGRISGSTISSFDPSASEVGALMEYIGAPTTAVVSYRKNTYSSQTALETFLPSVPINNPMSSIGSRYRYQASWPSEQSALARDDSALVRSSFKLTRCMKQEAFVPGAGIGSNYVHETLELKINLSRGTELLRLGTATLVLTGEEEGEIQIIVPVKAIDLSKKMNKKRVKVQPNKYGFFSGDSTRRFFLDENSTLRVGIRVLPQDTVMAAEDRERKENDLRQMLGSRNLKEMVQSMGDLNVMNGELRMNHYEDNDFTEATPSDDGPKSSNIFQNLFSCGALCATNCSANLRHDDAMPDDYVPREIHAEDNRELGLQSLISSVSESTDGSDCDYSEGDIEAEINNFRMATTLRRFT